MRVLFVHGMGRTPISGWPLLHRLRRAGSEAGSFGYAAALEDFDAIVARLVRRIALIAARSEGGGDTYILVGHSLGGVLLRAALARLPPGTRLPAHVYLLGSPILPSRIAASLKTMWAFRIFAGDCGQLLGCAVRMQAIASVTTPVTGIAGVRSLPGSRGRFGDEANDGVVSLGEVSAPWLTEQIEVPVVHTLLPSSGRVAEIIHGLNCQMAWL